MLMLLLLLFYFSYVENMVQFDYFKKIVNNIEKENERKCERKRKKQSKNIGAKFVATIQKTHR